MPGTNESPATDLDHADSEISITDKQTKDGKYFSVHTVGADGLAQSGFFAAYSKESQHVIGDASLTKEMSFVAGGIEYGPGELNDSDYFERTTSRTADESGSYWDEWEAGKAERQQKATYTVVNQEDAEGRSEEHTRDMRNAPGQLLYSSAVHTRDSVVERDAHRTVTRTGE